jgi:uncharacterized protein (DUF169 family)
VKKLQILEEKIGGQWTGIRIHWESIPNGLKVKQKMRLCEAIAESFRQSVVLPPDLIGCPGACRSLGLATHDEDLARTVSEKTHVPFVSVLKAIRLIPHLDHPIAALTLGIQDMPDVAVSYTKPEIAMRLIRRWQEIHGEGLHVDLSTFLSVCGGVVATAYQTAQISISLGCPPSRQDGIIGKDALVIGVPYGLIDVFK